MDAKRLSQLEAEFQKYDREYPEIYEMIKKLAYAAIKRGHTHYGIATIWEVIRHEMDIKTNTVRSNLTTPFKMPNNHRAYYARKFLQEHPQYPDFFHIAHLRSKGAIPVDRYGLPRDDDNDYAGGYDADI